MKAAILRILATPTMLAALATLGCGGGGGDDIALVDLPRELATALCQGVVECGQFADVESCVSSISADLGQAIADVEAGLASYDGDKARSCLASLVASDCAVLGGGLDSRSPDCDEIFEGTLEEGASCFSNEACAGESNCETPDPESCTAGVCTPALPPAAEGQSCDSGQGCQEGLFCSFDGVCLPQVPLGEVCTEAFSCADGGVCEREGQNPEGICITLPTRGESCNPELLGGFLSCRDLGDYCDTGTLICTQRVDVGQACEETQENCVVYASCIDSLCVADPGLGDSCSIDGAPCLGTLECNGEVCEALAPEPVCET